MNKLKIILFSPLFCISIVKAQLVISSGTTFHIQSGGVVTVQGDVTSNSDITGPGKLQLKGSSNQNVNMNGFTVPNLEMDNTANATLTGNARISSSMLFTNGKIVQDNFNVSLAEPFSLTGYDNSKYFVTSGTGRLIKENLGNVAFNFPVGNSTTTYNPVTITNSGTVDNIGVICLPNVLKNGSSGPAFVKEVADASWDINESVAGGSNLSLTTTWASTDELSGFERTRTGIAYYIPTLGPTQGWDLLNSQVGAAAGANPYTINRTGISSLGVFAVGTRPVLSPLLISPKIYLQGPYNTGTGVMSDGLRTVFTTGVGTTDATHGVIPTTDPYTGLSGFTHSGSGGGETITLGVFGTFNVTSNDAIVDWVFVQIHNNITGVVEGTRSALIQRDGDIVDTDGVSPLNMAGFSPGNYYVSVRHRNHLGVRSANFLTLAKTTTAVYNYTTAQTQAFPGIVTNNPMATLTASVFGMWGGDATGNKQTRYSGGGNDQNQLLNTVLGGNVGNSINGTYHRSDLNLNGKVSYSGGGNDQNILLNTVLGGIVGAVLTQPNF